MCGSYGRRLRLEREAECRALLDRTLRAHLPSVAGHNPLHGGQADARSRELGDVVKALKGGEQFRGVRRIEAGAVVPDEVLPGSARIAPHPEFDLRLCTLAAELP